MTAYSRLIVFYPSPLMVAPITALIERIAPHIEYQNLIAPDLLNQAIAHGVTKELRQQVHEIFSGTADDPDALIFCTCSTFGECAEEIGRQIGKNVIRIDRPMAEMAVQAGSRIGIAAALRSTLAPTASLLRDVARASGRGIILTEILCENAWSRKEAGDEDGYINDIVINIEDACRTAKLDAVVLAQGSMAAAARKCALISAPVFASPETAIRTIAKLFAVNQAALYSKAT